VASGENCTTDGKIVLVTLPFQFRITTAIFQDIKNFKKIYKLLILQVIFRKLIQKKDTFRFQNPSGKSNDSSH
jgi:hypothetical protein